ncbi:Nitrogen regulatory protein P-II [Ephemeroptericola cinctiostellae]|uniref:Nitrogen regulatory protein P-II n=1 Tax=Ephemeroptericola cinctiostellae TaxID=2268024 RepID=A0A345D9H0_9BURK|nr:P-II family nitrogen regulator [Ephemeroptericola cinctiostellae]AXF85008.1 Nitrogen regulatory protein P-II [Ephemeroptericola cinctiostellae]
MKLVTAIIRPEKLADVKAALFKVGVTGMSLTKIAGHGGEHEVLEHYRGQQVKLEFQEKIELKIAVSETFVDVTIATICNSAQTGEVGDGKIFVQPLERVVRIRTQELNEGALTPVGTDPNGPF